MFYQYGQRAALAQFEKTAYGGRQMRRFLQALSKQKTPAPKFLEEYQRILSRGFSSERRSPDQVADFLIGLQRGRNLHRSSSPHVDSGFRDAWELLQKKLLPLPPAGVTAWPPADALRETTEAFRQAVRRGGTPEELRSIARRVSLARERQSQLLRAQQTMLAGRHAPSVQRIPGPSELKADAHLTSPGVDPGHLAWRGGAPDIGALDGGRWVSGIPGVSGGYTQQSITHSLLGRDVSKVPAARQGPWSRHVAEDTRRLAPKDVEALPTWKNPAGGVGHTGGVGESPFYEKVMERGALAEAPVVARFKRIDPYDANIFMRTQGNIDIGTPVDVLKKTR